MRAKDLRQLTNQRHGNSKFRASLVCGGMYQNDCFYLEHNPRDVRQWKIVSGYGGASNDLTGINLFIMYLFEFENDILEILRKE